MGARYDAFDKKYSDERERAIAITKSVTYIEQTSLYPLGKHPAVIVLNKELERIQKKLERWDNS
jgi:hypothetical protein